LSTCLSGDVKNLLFVIDFFASNYAIAKKKNSGFL